MSPKIVTACTLMLELLMRISVDFVFLEDDRVCDLNKRSPNYHGDSCLLGAHRYPRLNRIGITARLAFWCPVSMCTP